MKTMLRGVIHGKTIELQDETGLPEGQEVTLSLEPLMSNMQTADNPNRDNGVAGIQAEALAVRKAWMRRHGFAEEEIQASCLADAGQMDLAEELANLKAVDELEKMTPAASELSRWATSGEAARPHVTPC